MNGPEIAASLAGAVDGAILSTDPQDLRAHSLDWTPRSLLAARRGVEPQWVSAVARPRNTEEVSDLLRWAHETRTTVVPFGGGSGVCGAISDPGTMSLVIDLTAMASIGEIDAKSRLVGAQAGVTGPSLAAALAEQGWMTGHEPQSVSISTVGGWVATRACGQLSARYGGIEDLVTGLEAVLSGGRIVRSPTTPRSATGPSVSSLMIGSEGCLGVITEATLRIVPIPEHRVDACLRFEDMADGVAACRAIAQSDVHPTLVRLYDAEDAAFFLRHHQEEPPGPLLLLSFDGDGASDRAARARSLSEEATPGNDSLVGHWWAHRNDAVAEFRRVMDGRGLLGPHGIVDTMEVSGTWSVLRDLYHEIKDVLSERSDLVGCHLSHVYPDGACLYFTIASACADDAEAAERLEDWWSAGMEACIRTGGSISHHHGIGRLKAPWLTSELGGWMEVLRAVKSTLDPRGIMNPGVLGL